MQLRRQSRIAAAFGIAALGVTVGALGSASAEDSSTGPACRPGGFRRPQRARTRPPARHELFGARRGRASTRWPARPRRRAPPPRSLTRWPRARRRTTGRTPAADLKFARHAEPVRLRRLQPARHDRRREQEPVRPGGQRDQGRGLRQERHPAGSRRSTSATCGAPGRCSNNAGDPQVNYDSLANRWVLAQFQDPAPALLRGLAGAEPARRLPPVRVQRPELPRLLQGRRVEERLLRLGEREHLHRVRVRPRQDARRRPERLVHQVRRRDELPAARRRRRQARERRRAAGSSTPSRTMASTAAARPDRALPADSGLRHPGEQHLRADQDLRRGPVHLHGLRLLQLRLHPAEGHEPDGRRGQRVADAALRLPQARQPPGAGRQLHRRRRPRRSRRRDPLVRASQGRRSAGR